MVGTPEFETSRDRHGISVVCATYRGAAHIDEQLDSIAAQTLLPAELVVVDDASGDATPDHVERFAERAPFPVRLIRLDRNQGAARTFARGLQEAQGSMVAFADQDDYWYPHRLEAGFERLSGMPIPSLVFSPADIVGPALEPFGQRTLDDRMVAHYRRADPFDTLVHHNLAAGMTMLFDMSLRSFVLPIPTRWMHDSWIAPIAAAVGSVGMVDEPLVAYRQHAGNLIGAANRSLPARYALIEQQRFLHHRRQVERHAALFERLGMLPEVQPEHIQIVGRQLDHWERRMALPPDTFARIPVVARELVTGGYHRCAEGWASVARDLLAPN